MSSEFADPPRLLGQPIERRTAPRGPIRGLTAKLPGVRTPVEVVEAGLRGVFVASDDLERFAVADEFAVTLERGDVSLECTVRVVRKESDARSGYALEVVNMTEEAREAFEAMRA